MLDTKWDHRFLNIAQEVADWSKDISTKVGCVAVLNKRILSTGYNGFPRNIEDSMERLSNRETKLKFVCHAEKNCIYNACHHGISLAQSTVYVHGCPICQECAKGLVQVGVKQVICQFDFERYKNTRWMQETKDLTIPLFEEVGIEYHEYFLDTT